MFIPKAREFNSSIIKDFILLNNATPELKEEQRVNPDSTIHDYRNNPKYWDRQAFANSVDPIGRR